MAAKQERASGRGALWLRRQRVRGRRRFIWAFIVPRFALPLTLLATAVRAATEPFRWSHFLLHLVVNVGVAGVGGGYLAGRMLWELVVARTEPPEADLRRRHSGNGRHTHRRAAGR